VLHNPASLPDLRVLAGIAEELGTGLPQGLGFRTPEQVWAEMTQVGPWDGERPASVSSGSPTAAAAPSSTAGELVLASWKQSIDDGRMQDGDDAMRATARKPVLLVGAATLDALGATPGELVT